jgi:hypothetical protein
MKNYIFEHTLGPLIEQYHPRVLVETGTHRGRSGCYMVQQSLRYHDDVEYHGFDLFETATAETDAKEINGKGHGSYKKAQARFHAIQQQYPNFVFTLYRGFTTDTFVNPIQADLAYIDGGHSTETVLHDFSMVKNSKVIVFDDYQMDSVKQALHIAGLADRVTPFITKKTHQAIFINT